MKECSVTEVLAAALLLLLTGREAQAEKMLSIPSGIRLLGTLTKNHHFLFRRNQSCELRTTLLLKALCIVQPPMLYQALVRIGFSKSYMVPKMMACLQSLLQEETPIPWGVSTLNAGLYEAAPQEYLETYFKIGAHHW